MEAKKTMVNTTRASLMAQICELRFFLIITAEEERKMIERVDVWDKRNRPK